LKFGLIAALVLFVTVVSAPPATAAPRVLVAHFEADVNPVTAEWLVDRIDDATSYDAIVIMLDTPGGLDEAMRKIVKAELGSSVPVIV
jgi:membrane-bound serine protease (ClpP class)